MGPRLKQQVDQVFADLKRGLGLRAKVIDDETVALVSHEQGYAILFVLSRDGLGVDYVDLRKPRSNAVNLDGFLSDKRRHLLPAPQHRDISPADTEYLHHMLTVVRDALSFGGQDILAGERDWFERYNGMKGDEDPRVFAE